VKAESLNEVKRNPQQCNRLNTNFLMRQNRNIFNFFLDREQQRYGLNKSAKFVVIITGIDTLPDSLIQNELDEASQRRLNISKELICLCYNKDAFNDESYSRLHESRNLPGVSELRTFLTKHLNQILSKGSDFNNYKYRQQ
jgi:hypothetical protein